MKVAFINHVRMFQINCGLAYIMTATGKHFPVKLIDINGQKSFEEYLKKELLKYQPGLICFSVNSFSLQGALYWAKQCKGICPKSRIMFGGVHPTLMPEVTISSPEVDYICIGEGEEALVEFLKVCQRNKHAVVPGIWRKDEKGNIVRSQLRSYIEDLNSVPMLNLDYWDMQKYLNYQTEFGGGLGILSARGCAYDCNFCSAPALRRKVPGKYYRCRDPKLVAEEIDYQYNRYKHFGIKYLHFDDACFGYDRQHLKSLAKELGEKGFPYNLALTCQSHPEIIDKEWISLVESIGCKHVAIGIESGDEYIRRTVHNKNITNKQIDKMIMDLRQSKLLFSFYMILDAPKENWLTAMRTFRMLLKVNSTKLLISFFFPLPGAKAVEKYNIKIPGQDNKQPYFVFSSFRSKPLGLVSAYVLYKIIVFVTKGIYLRQGRFIGDVLKYIFNVRGDRSVHLFTRTSFPELYRKTIIQYEMRDHSKSKNKDKYSRQV